MIDPWISEADFIKANPSRNRTDDTLCWVCGARCGKGICLCYPHLQEWYNRPDDEKVEMGGEIQIWTIDHPNFNGVRPHDPLALANSPWIAND